MHTFSLSNDRSAVPTRRNLKVRPDARVVDDGPLYTHNVNSFVSLRANARW